MSNMGGVNKLIQINKECFSPDNITYLEQTAGGARINFVGGDSIVIQGESRLEVARQINKKLQDGIAAEWGYGEEVEKPS